ncbi:MAG: SDR family NAD(P)-dependent oxidoreductase [Deltaproteobacteria bacterium]|nr:SDR family NAD(P)-dependent oxidoreductase [Deltaproteobacteria bacterium]
MKDLKGKLAVVTGGASGIGEAMVEVFAEAGMAVVVADIEAQKAEAVAARYAKPGVRCVGMGVDVASGDSVRALALRCERELGPVHVLCNNAGVLLMGPQADMIAGDWRWTFDVNVLGVAHGLEHFLPRMRAHSERTGEQAHVVNTASVTGLRGSAGTFIYSATKAAVLSISESLRDELAGTPIGVSVVLPSDIRSQIVASQRNRPSETGRAYRQSVDPELAAKHGLSPREVGLRVRDAILRNQFYVFTMPASVAPANRAVIEGRAKELLEALEAGIV